MKFYEITKKMQAEKTTKDWALGKRRNSKIRKWKQKRLEKEKMKNIHRMCTIPILAHIIPDLFSLYVYGYLF